MKANDVLRNLIGEEEKPNEELKTAREMLEDDALMEGDVIEFEDGGKGIVFRAAAGITKERIVNGNTIFLTHYPSRVFWGCIAHAALDEKVKKVIRYKEE